MRKEFILKVDNVRETKENLILELYRLRKKAKMSQILLSEKSNISRSTIVRAESLDLVMNLENLVKCAEALGCELSLVLKTKDENKEPVKTLKKH